MLKENYRMQDFATAELEIIKELAELQLVLLQLVSEIHQPGASDQDPLIRELPGRAPHAPRSAPAPR
jgi:hypothetical protein